MLRHDRVSYLRYGLIASECQPTNVLYQYYQQENLIHAGNLGRRSLAAHWLPLHMYCDLMDMPDVLEFQANYECDQQQEENLGDARCCLNLYYSPFYHKAL